MKYLVLTVMMVSAVFVLSSCTAIETADSVLNCGDYKHFDQCIIFGDD